MVRVTAENEGIKEIKLTNLSTIDQLDLSGGFTCDIETGICGPIEEKTSEKIEENKHANNNMV